jgi:Retroviral aspartyl protease
LLRRRRSDSLQFKRGSDDIDRPYLWVVVKGLNGREIEIQGLIDSGADKSVLPSEYAPLLGYSKDDLEPEEIDQVEGLAHGQDAQIPCSAYVRGDPKTTFPLQPLFVNTLDALWGRGDVMRAYVVTISERDREFRLRRR